MKYTSESFRSLSEAYETLNEQHGVEFESFIHDRKDKQVYEVEVSQTPTSIIVGCLKVDESPMGFFEDDEDSGTLKEFRSVDSRDEFLSTLKKSSLFFLVDKYEHGSVHYSVSGSKNYPDQRWDVAHGCGVYIPSEYIQEEYKKAKKKMTVAEAKEKFSIDANSTLDSYSDYCNGEVYGYSIVTYDKKGTMLNEEESWGIIGVKYANEEKSSLMKAEFTNSSVMELLKEVEIVKFTNTNQIPHLSAEELQSIHKNVDFNNVASGQYTEVYGEKILSVIHTSDNNAFVYHDNGIDKPFVARFEKWQLTHNVTPAQFTEARFMSDVKEVIRKNLAVENDKKLTLNV